MSSPSTLSSSRPGPAAGPALLPFKSVTYSGIGAGPRLIITGAVHGNETCGTAGIRRVLAELDDGTLRITRGQLTLVPVCNALAFQRGTREGDRNLNRALGPTASPQQFEDHVANWLCPLLAAHEVLLDLHSFRNPGEAFVFVGPTDNTGEIEPFAQAAREAALARVLGVGRAVDGWLSTYARGVQRRRAAAGPSADALALHPRFGVGTTEYMRSQGGCALTLECGQHDDPQAPEVAYQAIRRTLAHLQLTDEAPPPAASLESMSLHEVVDKADAGDRFARDWQGFDAVQAGELIGTRADGTPVQASEAGWLVFPDPGAKAGGAWFYLARASGRFA